MPSPDAHKPATSFEPPPLTYPHDRASGGVANEGESVRPIRPGVHTELVAVLVQGPCGSWRGGGPWSTAPGAWHLHCAACDEPDLNLCYVNKTAWRFDDFAWVVVELPMVAFACQHCGAWNAVPAMLGEGGIIPRLEVQSQPTQPEDLLAFSRPPARFSSSSAHGVVQRDGTWSDYAAQPPAPLPRPPGSGSGET